jgi:hypothetical protein
MRTRFLGIGILLTLAILACSMDTSPTPAVPTAEQTPFVLSTVKSTKTPLWQASMKNFGGFNAPTSDGGAIFAYAGTYLDYSIHWVPSYTNIKVIKIMPDGQAFQRIYGKLVGTEALDYIQSTLDQAEMLAEYWTKE